jgi:ABC-2 type transport system ATP-binding protein
MENALELVGVCKSYRGFALRDVSLSLPKGFVMGLIGPNGAGKTTLIKVIMGLARRDAGTVRVLGADDLERSPRVKARIAFVPDEPHHLADATLATIAAATAPFYPGWDAARFAALAADLELPLGKKFKALSHGTKTRFSLALALSLGAELLVLDEPTSGLDPVVRRDLLGRLSELIQDGRSAVLYSTHITSDLERVADLVTFMRDGAVVLSGTRDEMLDRWAVVRGGRELLDPALGEMFAGVRIGEHAVEALTARSAEARARLGAGAVVERATLEDIMALLGREDRHAA